MIARYPAARPSRPPYFSRTVEAEVSIDPGDLEDAGWVYVGQDGASLSDREALVSVIREAHDDEHDGPLRWCQHATCRALRGPTGELAE